jgi:hypothetical protein
MGWVETIPAADARERERERERELREGERESLECYSVTGGLIETAGPIK